MSQNDFGIRIAALVSVMLVMSTIVVYTTVNAKHDIPAPVSALGGPVDKPAGNRELGQESVLPLVTEALRNHEFARARALTSRLQPRVVRDQLMGVIRSAETSAALARIGDHIRSGRFDQARLLARELDEQGTRAQLLEIVTFAEARAALGKGDLDLARELSNTLPSGIKRALLLTALADKRARSGDRQRAIAGARLALRAMDGVPDKHRPQLLAMVARVLLPLEPEEGVMVLDEALHPGEKAASIPAPALPARPAGSAGPFISRAGSGFFETVSAADARQVFSLAVPGAEGNLHELLAAHHSSMRCRQAKTRIHGRD